jgi:hypothetical protein
MYWFHFRPYTGWLSAVACVCVVLVAVGAVALRKRAHKNKKEVLFTSEDSYADMSGAAEVANPVCKIWCCGTGWILMATLGLLSLSDTGERVNAGVDMYLDERESWRNSADAF